MAYPSWESCSAPVKCRGCKSLIPPGADIWIKAKGVYYCGDCGLVAEAAGDEVKPGGVEEKFLKDLNKLPEEAAETTLAGAARLLARQWDCGEVTPRDVIGYSKEIRLNLLQLIDLYPPDNEEDDTEQKRAKLAERRRREQGGM